MHTGFLGSGGWGGGGQKIKGNSAPGNHTKHNMFSTIVCGPWRILSCGRREHCPWRIFCNLEKFWMWRTLKCGEILCSSFIRRYILNTYKLYLTIDRCVIHCTRCDFKQSIWASTLCQIFGTGQLDIRLQTIHLCSLCLISWAGSSAMPRKRII